MELPFTQVGWFIPPYVALGTLDRLAHEISQREGTLLVTRISNAHFAAVREKEATTVHHEVARCITIDKSKRPKRAGTIAVVCAGTSDLPVAEEATVTAEIMGNEVLRVCDVGVAGLHRLLRRLEEIRRAMILGLAQED